MLRIRRGDEFERSFVRWDDDATHRQQSRRRVTDCAKATAPFGQRTAIQRQSASDRCDNWGAIAPDVATARCRERAWNRRGRN